MNPPLHMCLLRVVISLKRMIDVVLNIDSLFLEENESVDDLVAHIRERFDFGYEPTYEVLYEETVEE